MLAPSHQVFGFTCGLVTLTIAQIIGFQPNSLISTIIFMGMLLFGSIFPDIDSPNTRLGRKFWPSSILLLAALLTSSIQFPSLTEPFKSELFSIGFLLLPMILTFFGHRKFTHSLLFLALMSVYGFLFKRYVGVDTLYISGFLIGCFSHLLSDFLTSRGIPLLYPIHKKYFRFLFTFRTGSFTEKVIVLILSIINVLFIVKIFLDNSLIGLKWELL